MLTAIVDELIRGLPSDHIRKVLTSPTVGSLTAPTLERLCAEIGNARTPWPASVECDDLEWSVYLEKLGWAISSDRRLFRGQIAKQLATPSMSEPEARVYVALCSLYMHGVAIAQHWSPDYEGDAIQLMSIAVYSLDMRTGSRVCVLLRELAQAKRKGGWAVSRCLASAMTLLLISSAEAHVRSLLEVEVPADDDSEDWIEWQRGVVSFIALSATELEIEARKLFEGVSHSISCDRGQ